MADEPDNLMLRLLRQLDAKMDRVLADVHDLKVRTTAVERGLAECSASIAGCSASIAGINGRIDRVDARLDRIEKRLELAEV